MALRGIQVVELAGLAPGPFCGMVLSDFGAKVIRVDKAGSQNNLDCLGNGKESISLNLKHEKGVEIFRKLCLKSDVMLETYRAGVMESFGLGPDILRSDNAKLIYARLSGYGQMGCFSKRAGHDINYVALTGLLPMFGRTPEKPFPPLNILADFAGGGLMCALGITMALFERTISGMGQVIDSNMVEGAAYVGSWLYRSQDLPFFGKDRGQNMLDGGAHYYETYETKDGKYMAVGAIENKFYLNFLKGLNLTEDECPQFTVGDKCKQMIRNRFWEKTQQEWCEIFNDVDACVTPVLSPKEATKHPHNMERKSFLPGDNQGNILPGPAPKLSRTPAESKAMTPLEVGQHTEKILESLNYSKKEISQMEKENIIDVFRQ